MPNKASHGGSGQQGLLFLVPSSKNSSPTLASKVDQLEGMLKLLREDRSWDWLLRALHKDQKGIRCGEISGPPIPHHPEGQHQPGCWVLGEAEEN